MNRAFEQPRPDGEPAPARHAMGLMVDSRSVGDVVVVQCQGRMDLGEGLDVLADAVKTALNSGHSVLLNLGGVEAIDAAGLGVLADLKAHACDGRGLRLCNVPKQVGEVIALTHLADVLDCYPTEKDGLASYLGLAAFWRAS